MTSFKMRLYDVWQILKNTIQGAHSHLCEVFPLCRYIANPYSEFSMN